MKINRFKDLDHFYVGYSSLSYNLSGLINFMMDVANQHNNGFRNSDHNPNLTTCFNWRMKNFEYPWLPQILRFQISFSFFISPIQYIFQNKFSFSYVLGRFYETTYPDSFAIRRFPSHLPNRGLSLPIDISLYDFLTLRIKKKMQHSLEITENTPIIRERLERKRLSVDFISTTRKHAQFDSLHWNRLRSSNSVVMDFSQNSCCYDIDMHKVIAAHMSIFTRNEYFMEYHFYND